MARESMHVTEAEKERQHSLIREIRDLPHRPQTYHVVTYGCQMNAHDSEIIAGMLEEMGMTPAAVREEADFVIFALPAQHVRSAISSAVPFIRKDAIVTCISKGIEQKTHKRMSEVIGEYFDLDRYVCISGPSHAEEVGIGVPTCVAMSSRKE